MRDRLGTTLHTETRGSQNGAFGAGATRRVGDRGRAGDQASPCPEPLCGLRTLNIGVLGLPSSPHPPARFLQRLRVSAFTHSLVHRCPVAGEARVRAAGGGGARRAGSWQRGRGPERRCSALKRRDQRARAPRGEAACTQRTAKPQSSPGTLFPGRSLHGPSCPEEAVRGAAGPAGLGARLRPEPGDQRLIPGLAAQHLLHLPSV